MAFSDVFTFSRPTAAPYVDAGGVARSAPADTPRFGYLSGQPRGLVVDGGAAMGQGDRVRLRARDWSASPTWTVLHDWDPGTGRRLDAHYTRDPAAMINGCLSFAGYHRRIAAYAGYLPNYGGWVWALGTRWTLPAILGTQAGVTVSRILIA